MMSSEIHLECQCIRLPCQYLERYLRIPTMEPGVSLQLQNHLEWIVEDWTTSLTI